MRRVFEGGVYQCVFSKMRRIIKLEIRSGSFRITRRAEFVICLFIFYPAALFPPPTPQKYYIFRIIETDKLISNFQLRLIHFWCSDWFTQLCQS